MQGILIKNGTVIDGTGKPRFNADVIIEGERIVQIGSANGADSNNGYTVIDAAGKIVCPGMIDPHSHADMTIHRADHPKILEPLILQGITTFIGGNCGMSLAPLGGEHYETAKMYLEGFTARELDADVSWSDTAGLMAHLDTSGLALNCALLAPHSLLRIETMGMANRHATDDEVKQMASSLENCMDAGCIGMSTGLQYMPGLQSDTSELTRLGAVLKKYDAIFTSHLRSYMSELSRAVDEVVSVARDNDIRAQVSHLFWVPDYGILNPIVHGVARSMIKLSKHWTAPLKLDDEIEKQIAKLMRMKKKGINVGADVIPTTTTFTHLAAYLPPWVLNGSRDEVRERLTDPRLRKRIRYDIENGKMTWPHSGRNTWSLNILKLLGWESTIIMSVFTRENKHLEGKNLAEIGRLRNKHPFEAMCDLLVEEEVRILVFSALGEPEDSFTERSIFAGVAHPEVSISTDSILMGIGLPSHLFHGAFPRLMERYVRKKKMLTLETAVRKTSGLPAEHFRLKQRGLIQDGYFADIVIFDPASIASNCDFKNPAGKPSGIEHVFINGRHAVKHGEANNQPLPGKLIRRDQ